MNFNKGNYNKTTFQADIKRKQAMFNRFKKRFYATTDPVERRFLKNEAYRVANELQQWARRWQNWNFGPCNWITKNYTTTCFTNRTTTCRTNRKVTTGRTYGRTTTYGNYGNRTNRTPRTRTTNRTRNTTRATYTAW